MNLKLVETYFSSWKIYSIRLLKKAFHRNANYIILNKDTSYRGLNSIEKYWIRNKKRQQNLNTNYNIIENSKNYCKIAFEASFFDSQEQQNQKINGIIEFNIREGKIIELRENYYKWVSPIDGNGHYSKKDSIISSAQLL